MNAEPFSAVKEVQDEAEPTSMACLPQDSQKSEPAGKCKLPTLAVKEQTSDPSDLEESEGLHIFHNQVLRRAKEKHKLIQ